jgi:membrane-associated PAP2 superfamily phosphatase
VYDPSDPRERRRTEALDERPYRELDEDEKKQRRKMDKLRKECGPGQAGMRILGWAYRLGAFGYFCMAAAGLILTLNGHIGTVTYLIAGLNALFALISTLGLAYCCAGPSGMRGSALVGVCVGLASCILSPLSVTMTANAFRYDPLNPPELYESRGESAVAHYASMGPVHMLPQLPGFALANKNIPWLALLAGVMELVRNFFVCAIARYYAEEGKDPDLGYRANRYLFRLTVIMVVITFLSLAGWAMEQRGWFLGTQRYDYLFLAVVINLGVDTLLVSVAAQSQALMDIADITDARRYVDRQTRLDSV